MAPLEQINTCIKLYYHNKHYQLPKKTIQVEICCVILPVERRLVYLFLSSAQFEWLGWWSAPTVVRTGNISQNMSGWKAVACFYVFTAPISFICFFPRFVLRTSFVAYAFISIVLSFYACVSTERQEVEGWAITYDEIWFFLDKNTTVLPPGIHFSLWIWALQFQITCEISLGSSAAFFLDTVYRWDLVNNSLKPKDFCSQSLCLFVCC